MAAVRAPCDSSLTAFAIGFSREATRAVALGWLRSDEVAEGVGSHGYGFFGVSERFIEARNRATSSSNGPSMASERVDTSVSCDAKRRRGAATEASVADARCKCVYLDDGTLAVWPEVAASATMPSDEETPIYDLA